MNVSLFAPPLPIFSITISSISSISAISSVAFPSISSISTIEAFTLAVSAWPTVFQVFLLPGNAKVPNQKKMIESDTKLKYIKILDMMSHDMIQLIPPTQLCSMQTKTWKNPQSDPSKCHVASTLPGVQCKRKYAIWNFFLWTLDTCLIHKNKFGVLPANAECQIWSHMTLWLQHVGQTCLSCHRASACDPELTETSDV